MYVLILGSLTLVFVALTIAALAALEDLLEDDQVAAPVEIDSAPPLAEQLASLERPAAIRNRDRRT